MRLIKTLILASFVGLASISGAGCADISRVPVTKPELQVPTLPALSLNDVDWIVVTRDNVDKVLSQLEFDGKEPVLYALDDENYAKHEDNQEQVQGRIIVLMRLLKETQEYYKPDQKSE